MRAAVVMNIHTVVVGRLRVVVEMRRHKVAGEMVREGVVIDIRMAVEGMVKVEEVMNRHKVVEAMSKRKVVEVRVKAEEVMSIRKVVEVMVKAEEVMSIHKVVEARVKAEGVMNTRKVVEARVKVGEVMNKRKVEAATVKVGAAETMKVEVAMNICRMVVVAAVMNKHMVVAEVDSWAHNKLEVVEVAVIYSVWWVMTHAAAVVVSHVRETVVEVVEGEFLERLRE